MATFDITTNIPVVTDALERFGDDAVSAVYAGILTTGYESLNEARTKAPKGATSELVRSITLEEDEGALQVDVFSSLAYSAFINFGYNDTQNVREHRRTIAYAFGKRIKPVTITVQAHKRQVVRAAVPYMTSAAEMAEANVSKNVLAELEALEL